MDGGHKLAGGITMFFVFSNSSTLLVPGMRAPISGGYNHQSDCCDYSFKNDIVTLLNVFVLLQSCLDFWWVIWCLFFSVQCPAVLFWYLTSLPAPSRCCASNNIKHTKTGSSYPEPQSLQIVLKILK